MEHEPTPKKILFALISIMPQVVKLFEDKQDYSKLINFLSAQNYYDDDEQRYPTLKKIQAETGLSYSQIKKQLIQIHDNIFDSNIELNFTKVEIYIIAGYSGAS